MTVICGGGSSSARPEFAQSLYVGPAAIAALLNNIPTAFAVPLAGYIGAQTYNLSTFCTNDPPPVPSFTAQDVLDLLNVFNPIANVPASEKFQQLVGAFLWYQVCQCDTVPTPAPPAPPATPPGIQVNPTVAPAQTEVACFDYGEFGRGIGGGTFPQFEIFNRQPGMTGFSIDYFWVDGGGPHGGINYQFEQRDVNNTLLQTTPVVFSFFSTVRIPYFLLLLPATTTVRVVMNNPTQPTSADALRFQARGWCGNGPNTAVQPCCPPDPILQSQIDTILQLVTLIQRQSVPFAYVPGTVHPGLTGSGEITVQGLIGARVLLTATPPRLGTAAGDPETIFEAGWINWGNADGWDRRQFINANPITSLPPSAGQYTRIGYTLLPGVTATITELRREP